MPDNRNNSNWEEHKNQKPQQNNQERGSKEEISDEKAPQDRLNDGTNDFKNGDQEPTSENSSGE